MRKVNGTAVTTRISWEEAGTTKKSTIEIEKIMKKILKYFLVLLFFASYWPRRKRLHHNVIRVRKAR